jgi:hypothetical protein
VVAPPRSDAYEDGESGLVCRPAVELNPPARGSDASLCGLVCAVGVNPLARGSDARLRGLVCAVEVNPSAMGSDARLRGRERRNYSTTISISHRRSLRRRLQGQVFGKPLHSFSRFGLQDAQTPPSPRVGEGGWGDEGQSRNGVVVIAERPRFWRSFSGCRHLAGCAPEARAPRASPLPAAGFLASPCVPSPVSGSRTPRLPLLPVWEKGVGGLGAPKRTGKLTYPFTAPPAAGTPVAVTAASAVWWV